MIGKKSQKRYGFPRKKHQKNIEERLWRRDHEDEQLYPELEDDEEILANGSD